jgi:predicted O-methyltransferase YrrM
LSLLKTPIIGPLLALLLRTKIAIQFSLQQAFKAARWLVVSRETTNFTYDLDQYNKRYLAYTISKIVRIEFSEALSYIEEIEQDSQFRAHIENAIAQSDYRFLADAHVRLGRRLGWYVIARAIKPKVIVETGVDKGLGACVLTAALRRNAHEGHRGTYYGTDINPKAGYLLSGEYAAFGQILYGDSIDSLRRLDSTVDLFINDSDHSSDYEAREYVEIEPKLSQKSIIIGDNSHYTDALLLFSIKHGREFTLFVENPIGHWYRGAGIGVSYMR